MKNSPPSFQVVDGPRTQLPDGMWAVSIRVVDGPLATRTSYWDAEGRFWTLHRVEGDAIAVLDSPTVDEPPEVGATLASLAVKEELAASADDPVPSATTTERLGTLADVERRVLELRFGFQDGHPLPAEEVAARLGISVEEVTSLEQSGLSKLQGG